MTDAGGPFIHPADAALNRLEPRKIDPDGFFLCDPDRQLDPTTLWRNVLDIDPPAVFARTAELNIGLERNPLRPASMVLHGGPPAYWPPKQ